MPLVNPTLPNDGESADAADISQPFLDLLAVFNGHIGADNLEPGTILAGNIASNAVTTVKIANGAVTNAKLDTVEGGVGGPYTAFIPTWVNLTIGNGTIISGYTRVGRTIKGYYSITFGTTSSVSSGAVTMTLPVESKALDQGLPIGSVYIDKPGVSTYSGIVGYVTSTTVNFLVPNGSADTRLTQMNSTHPIGAFGVNSSVRLTFEYEAAA